MKCFAKCPVLSSLSYKVQVKVCNPIPFESSENIQNKEGGPDRSVSDKQSFSATLN